jgi:hypothetical protein
MAEAFREDTKLSVGALLPVLILGDLFANAYYRRHAHWKRLVELFPYVLAGMVPGYLVLWRVPGGSLRVLLGALVLALLTLHLTRGSRRWQNLLDRPWFTAITGVLAGFGTTVGNAAGPVMSIYLVSRRLDKHGFLGTSAWFFFLVNVSKLPFYAFLGMITPQTLQLDLLLAPPLAVGAICGVALARRIPQGVFNALVLSLAAAAAVRLIFW